MPKDMATEAANPLADVMARLPKLEAKDYEKLKSSLLRKYRLSVEAFRQKFRDAEIVKGESYLQFAYKLEAYMEERLREARL